MLLYCYPSSASPVAYMQSTRHSFYQFSVTLSTGITLHHSITLRHSFYQFSVTLSTGITLDWNQIGIGNFFRYWNWQSFGIGTSLEICFIVSVKKWFCLLQLLFKGGFYKRKYGMRLVKLLLSLN